MDLYTDRRSQPQGANVILDGDRRGKIALSESLLSEAFAATTVTNVNHGHDETHIFEALIDRNDDPTSYRGAVDGPNRVFRGAAMRRGWGSLLEVDAVRVYEGLAACGGPWFRWFGANASTIRKSAD